MTRLLILFLSVSFLCACGSGNQQSAEGSTEQTAETFNEETPEEWTPMENYHFVMAETFHPMEEGDLEPIKSRVNELVKAAKTWAESEIPARYNTEAIRTQLNKLNVESAQMEEIVRKGTDEEIITALTDLHDTFHAMMDLCAQVE